MRLDKELFASLDSRQELVIVSLVTSLVAYWPSVSFPVLAKYFPQQVQFRVSRVFKYQNVPEKKINSEENW